MYFQILTVSLSLCQWQYQFLQFQILMTVVPYLKLQKATPLQKTKNLDLLFIQPHWSLLLLLIQKRLIPTLSQPDVILRDFVDHLIILPVTDTSVFRREEM